MKSKTLSIAVAILLVIAMPFAMAETRFLRCTYLLERWKIDDLKDHPNCPSGEKGLGKPWMIETFTFDLGKGSWSPATIERNTCMDGVTFVQAHLTQQQDVLIFSNPQPSKVLIDLFGPFEIVVIDRKTLKTGSGNTCELVVNKQNKI